jgi:hypothetical protein
VIETDAPIVPTTIASLVPTTIASVGVLNSLVDAWRR